MWTVSRFDNGEWITLDLNEPEAVTLGCFRFYHTSQVKSDVTCTECAVWQINLYDTVAAQQHILKLYQELTRVHSTVGQVCDTTSHSGNRVVYGGGSTQQIVSSLPNVAHDDCV